jgi:hypothetical protein
MKYVRVYADADGESHFEDVAVELTPVTYAPPAPMMELSTVVPATGFAFVRMPVGWDGDWHPTPRRQLIVYLAGEIEGETSDGEVRRFGPGSATLAEDTTGKGHRSRVVGDADVLLAVVQLPD